MTDSGPSPAAPPHELVTSRFSDGEWHRLHPLTPLLRGGLALLVVVGVIIANLRDRVLQIFLPWLAPDFEDQVGEELEDDAVQWEGNGDPIDFIIANNLYLVAVLVVLAGILLVIAGFYLSWRFHTLRITDDDVEVRSGILFRTQRRAPLDRVQGVNLTRPMIARLLGMAKLEVVGAGTDSNVKLEYLSTTDAETVRADILRLASGRRLAAAAAGSPARPAGRVAALGQTVSRELSGMIDGAEAPVDVPESVVNIPVGRLVASQVVSPSTIGLILAAAAIAVGVSQGITWLLFGFVPAIIGFGAYWVRSIVRSLRYSIAPTPDGVRITFGLLTTVTEIVPPGRVHAIEVSQPILWRPAGWWTVRINRLTGRSATDSTTDQFTTVLPVGTASDVERVLRLLQPSVPEVEWALIAHEGMHGTGAGDAFTNSPRRARWIRPLSYRRNGFRLTEDLLLLRRGLIWRRLGILPLARLQSLALHQGPLDRATRVASLRAHVVTGPVYAGLAAIDRDLALGLFQDAAAAAVRAATVDTSHRWAQDHAEAPSPEAGAELALAPTESAASVPPAPESATAPPAAGEGRP